MTRNRYKIFESDFPYFSTSTNIDWFPLLKPDPTKLVIIDSLKYLQKHVGLKIFAYVIMHNHLHLIISSRNPGKHISNFKSFTARTIIDYYKDNKDFMILRKMEAARPKYRNDRNYKFWQEGYHPKQIISMEMFKQKIDYIHLNPVRKGYVDSPEKWKWSSANPNGLVEIDPIED